jgi:hypothetical protein
LHFIFISFVFSPVGVLWFLLPLIICFLFSLSLLLFFTFLF